MGLGLGSKLVSGKSACRKWLVIAASSAGAPGRSTRPTLALVPHTATRAGACRRHALRQGEGGAQGREDQSLQSWKRQCVSGRGGKSARHPCNPGQPPRSPGQRAGGGEHGQRAVAGGLHGALQLQKVDAAQALQVEQQLAGAQVGRQLACQVSH